MENKSYGHKRILKMLSMPRLSCVDCPMDRPGELQRLPTDKEMEVPLVILQGVCNIAPGAGHN